MSRSRNVVNKLFKHWPETFGADTAVHASTVGLTPSVFCQGITEAVLGSDNQQIIWSHPVSLFEDCVAESDM